MMLNKLAQSPIAIETWPIDRPQRYERNARTHSPEQIEQLRSSFRTYGQVWPILVREDGTVISGHGRIEAAKAEGYETLQVIVARGWTPEQCRSFALLDNRVPLNAAWDDEMLRIEIADLTGLGIDVGTLGFATRELDLLLGPIVGAADPDDVPALPVEAVTIVGDQWVLGGHRLLCGDATSAADVLTALGGETPVLMVTDPPYGVEYDPEWRSNANRWAGSTVKLGAKAFGKVSNDDNASWAPAWKLFPGDVAYVWHGGLRCIDQAESLEQVGFVIRSQIVWNKGRLVIGRGDYHWQHDSAAGTPSAKASAGIGTVAAPKVPCGTSRSRWRPRQGTRRRSPSIACVARWKPTRAAVTRFMSRSAAAAPRSLLRK